MAKRYVMSTLVEHPDPFGQVTTLPFVVTQNPSGVAIIFPTNNQGNYVKNWAFCIVADRNIGRIIADSRNHVLPDFPLDGKISALHTPTKNQMLRDMEARGINTDFVRNADGYREVIRAIGRALQEFFNENFFDVSE